MNLRSTDYEADTLTTTPSRRLGAALAHLYFLLLHVLVSVLGTEGSGPSALEKGGSGVLANCSLCGTEATDG